MRTSLSGRVPRGRTTSAGSDESTVGARSARFWAREPVGDKGRRSEIGFCVTGRHSWIGASMREGEETIVVARPEPTATARGKRGLLTEGEGGYAKNVLPVFDDISDGCMGQEATELDGLVDGSHANTRTDPLTPP
jgi:hypothetical protein